MGYRQIPSITVIAVRIQNTNRTLVLIIIIIIIIIIAFFCSSSFLVKGAAQRNQSLVEIT